MANVVIFDPNTTPQRVLEYLESVNTPQYLGRPDVVINPDISGLVGVSRKYWKHVAGSVVEMTPAEKVNVDAAEAADSDLRVRTSAKAQLEGFAETPLLFRAIADTIKDEINALRKCWNDFQSQVAAATTLADLKSRVAGLPALPDRTLEQFKTVIDTKIDGKIVDSKTVVANKVSK